MLSQTYVLQLGCCGGNTSGMQMLFNVMLVTATKGRPAVAAAERVGKGAAMNKFISRGGLRVNGG